ncbi:unnamed protein product [Adineta steineri]|uniref:EF-hand domain-containing protein n=1 Tax=Adineta steineri TaxID=433720 RepID=A0A815RAV3_9BILA|nr:unnamed protein product [Adineta steineri]
MSTNRKSRKSLELTPKEIAALLEASHITEEDVNKDNTIDFNEFLVVIVLINRINDLGSRLSFVFDMWDQSDDGHIDQKELANVITAIYDRAGISDRKGERDPKKRAKEIIAKLDISGDKKLNKEEFITGCKNDPIIRNLLAPNV